MEKERIFKIIAEVLGIDQNKVAPESNFKRDLGADSLDMVQMMMLFEDEFDIEISDDEVSYIQTVQEILDYAKKVGI